MNVFKRREIRLKEEGIVEISKDVYWVGAKGWNRRLFDSLIPLPQGTSYNSYLVKGEKAALIDTVNPGFERELERKVNKIRKLKEIDYVVMNHASQITLERSPIY